MGDSVRPTMLMLGLSHLRLFLLGTATVLVSAAPMTYSCKPVEPAADFQLDAYLGKWFIQQQMETKYLPKGRNYCVVAEYSRKSKSLFGWDLNVHKRHKRCRAMCQGCQRHQRQIGSGSLLFAPCAQWSLLGDSGDPRLGVSRRGSADHPNHGRFVQDRRWSE